MKERVVCFGPGGVLVGILTEPDVVVPDSPVVVMTNIGLNHRVGPARIWVEIARRLAKVGLTSFRFDSSGLGDSGARTELVGDIERAELDLTDAIDWLTSRGRDSFALIALCSGTDAAHRVTKRDARVVRAVFIDGYTYPTPRYRLTTGPLKVVSMPYWKRWSRRKFPEMFGLPGRLDVTGLAQEIYVREYPPVEEFRRDVAAIVDRGCRLMFAYTGGAAYCYPEQFWDWMGRPRFEGRVSVLFDRRADHVLTFKNPRQDLLREICLWLQ